MLELTFYILGCVFFAVALVNYIVQWYSIYQTNKLFKELKRDVDDRTLAASLAKQMVNNSQFMDSCMTENQRKH